MTQQFIKQYLEEVHGNGDGSHLVPFWIEVVRYEFGFVLLSCSRKSEWINEMRWLHHACKLIQANPSYTFQRDHAQGVARWEPLHVGKAARRLNQHRERHFSCLLSSMSIPLQKGQARIWQLSLASSYLSLEPPQPTLLMTVAVFFPCRKISIIRAAMEFDRSPHGGK